MTEVIVVAHPVVIAHPVIESHPVIVPHVPVIAAVSASQSSAVTIDHHSHGSTLAWLLVPLCLVVAVLCLRHR